MKMKLLSVTIVVIILAGYLLAKKKAAANDYRDMIESIHQITQTVISDPENRKAFNILIEAAKGEGRYGEVQSYALSDLGNVGAVHAEVFYEKAVPVIIDGMGSQDEFVVTESAKAAGKFGGYAETAISALLEAINSHPTAIIPSVDSLAKIRRQPEVVLPVLAGMVPNRDPVTGSPRWARGYELEAIGAFGKDAKMAVPALERALQDSDSEYALKAARAFAKVEPENKALVDFLLTTYEKGDQIERHFVLIAIREMNLSGYPQSLENLIRLGLNDSSGENKELAKAILERQSKTNTP